MVKAELINQVSQELKMSKKEVAKVVDTIFSGISQSLSKGDKVELRGFGSFRIKSRSARQARNPRTGETVSVQSKRVPFFKPGKDLKIIG